MKQSSRIATLAAAALVLAGVARADWTRRMGNAQNTGQGDSIPGLTAATAADLQVVGTLATGGVVSATPVVAGDLLVTGDWNGLVHVFDLATSQKLVVLATGSGGNPGSSPIDLVTLNGILQSKPVGMQSTPAIGTVTIPDPSAPGGTREDQRVYVTTSKVERDLWCLDLDRIRADRSALLASQGDGAAYLCDGAAWPLSVIPAASKATTIAVQGAALFSQDQPIRLGGPDQIRDVLFQPSAGWEAAGGELWALDAVTGEKLWVYAPSPIASGGTIWTSLSMSRDRSMLYVTTNNLPTFGTPTEDLQSEAGRAESLVALDPATGQELWYHQRRIFDNNDYDIGNGATVADVEGPNGCHVVVSPDKDGCVYTFNQAKDIAAVGDPAYDPLRPGQQRLRWRQCFTPGSLEGGFDAMTASFDGSRVFVQVTGFLGHFGADDANAFALDACTGSLEWESSSIGNGFYEGAVADGMFFAISGAVLQVVSATGSGLAGIGGVAPTPTVLATVSMPSAVSIGGGGPAISGGRIYVPTTRGVVVVALAPRSHASPPIVRGNNLFAGPYPAPVAHGEATEPLPPIDPQNPYRLTNPLRLFERALAAFR